jgi:ribosomal protein S18 acetylase RimI-like enzyme
MATSQLFVVRRCDGFYRFWHDVMAPASLHEAQAVYDRLTRDGTHSTAPDSAEYYDIFATDSLSEWTEGPAPLIRRLHPSDLPAIEMHLLGLDFHDRRLRFFREATDAQVRAYVRDIDWSCSLILGAIRADRVVAMAEALFDCSGAPHHAEIAVSVDHDLRRRGLGGHLIAQAVERVGALGARQTSLSFLRENRPIQRIVRALGGLLDMEDLVGSIPTAAFAHAPAAFDQRLAA